MRGGDAIRGGGVRMLFVVELPMALTALVVSVQS